MVYSSSNIWADYKYADPLFFIKRQLIFASLGVVSMLFIMNIAYHFWKKYAKLILLTCFILLLVVKIPGIGIVGGGAQSCIGVGGCSIQASEFIEFGLSVFVASCFFGA